jgi:hypothetical protein
LIKVEVDHYILILDHRNSIVGKNDFYNPLKILLLSRELYWTSGIRSKRRGDVLILILHQFGVVK